MTMNSNSLPRRRKTGDAKDIGYCSHNSSVCRQDTEALAVIWTIPSVLFSCGHTEVLVLSWSLVEWFLMLKFSGLLRLPVH